MKNERGLRALVPIVAACVVAGAVSTACSPETKRYVPNVGDGYTTPTMATADVSTFISDSGYTRYKLETPLWQIFDDVEDPVWRFPDGLAVEQYDLHMNPVSNVVCDSAIYFSNKRLWRLDGNVVMVNTDADSFLTQQLFWDQARRVIHSDSFIHIVRTDRVIEGYGFESDQSMKYYTVRRPTAILPVNSSNMRGGKNSRSDTTETDSTVTKRAATQPRPSATTRIDGKVPMTNPTSKVVSPRQDISPDGSASRRKTLEPAKKLNK